MPNEVFDQFITELRAAPQQTIHAVIHPSGVCAGQAPGDAYWHMTFALAAWARPEGPVQRRKVRGRRDIERSDIETYRERLPDYGVVALEVSMLEHEMFGEPQAWLHAILPEVPTRADLFQIAEDLAKPVTTEDLQFGTFTLNRQINWHQAKTFWGVNSVSLDLSSDEDNDSLPQGTLAQARALWDDQERWDREVREAMVGELLELKNDSWLGDDETEFSAEEFLAGVTLDAITVKSDGSFEFWYDDGDLFWGHAIMVSGSLEGGINDAGIRG